MPRRNYPYDSFGYSEEIVYMTTLIPSLNIIPKTAALVKFRIEN